ncbi:DBF4-type zinc finger-containing protein 2 isoform X1 [Nelusetta ayraudi]
MWEEPEMGAEPEAGPSGHQPSRQGYCGYCRLLYSNLEQHLSSLKHLESIQATTRVPNPQGFSTSTSSVLLERFLQDVLLHHPHRYQDPRPPDIDLPSGSAPPLSWGEPDQVPECTPGSGETKRLSANQGADSRLGQQSEAGLLVRLAAPIRAEDQRTTCVEGMPTSCGKAQSPPPQAQAPPTVHRKVHRKTNRRKSSESSPSVPWGRWPKTQQEALFSSDNPDPLVPPVTPYPVGQTMEEVIRRFCHGRSSSSCQQEEFKDLQFSLPTSTETVSDDWDSALQVELQTPNQVSRSTRQELTCLMDLQVLLEDQVYQDQLHSTLHLSGSGAKQDQAPPLESRHVPESFRGKSWAQIQQEDEEKVERLVRQFRRHTFTCYFDSESLARYGRRRLGRKGRVQEEEVAPPPLDVQDEEDVVGVARRKRGRGFTVASRCQVVKVSHGTQTYRLLVPEVRPANQEAPAPAANQETAAAVTPVTARPTGGQAWRCLPSCYSPIVTPLQPCTTMLYLLPLSPGSTPLPRPLTMPPGLAHSLAPGSTPRRCRKKRRPLDQQGSKVKYKQLPVRFYDPNSRRVLKSLPPSRGSAPSCRRQLFRSLSPNLNAHRPQGEGPPEVKGQMCSAILLSTLSRDSAQSHRGGRSKVAKALLRRPRPLRLRPLVAKRSSRAEAPPPQAPPRREGLRRTGSSGRSSAAPPLRGRRGRSFRKNSNKQLES